MAIRILIDSASDIHLQEAQKMGVDFISMCVNFGEKEFYDGIDLLADTFYDKLENEDFPRTSQINPYRFTEKFQEMTKDGDEVIAITLSSKLSGTYQSAVTAAEGFNGVYVVDSLSACIGERLLCQYALECIQAGDSAQRVVEKLNEAKGNLRILAIVDTLEYLKKGGRISATVALIGNMLSVKPLIGVVDGEVKMVGKALGSKRAYQSLRTMTEKYQLDSDKPMGLVWSGRGDDVLEHWRQHCPAVWGMQTATMPAYIIGSTIGTHVGPGAIGIAFFEASDAAQGETNTENQ